MPADQTNLDVVVIGAGIVGSCTAYHLAKSGKKTLLIEQFPLPHTRGSSHGQSRITRKIYSQERYTSMMKEAYQKWHEIEELSKTELYKNTPMLFAGLMSDPASMAIPSILKKHKINHKVMSKDELSTEYPMLKYDDADLFVVDYEAGILKADKCLRSVQELFTRYGGIIHDGEKVMNIIPGDTVTVKTSHNLYKAAGLVITAGPWASQILKPLGINLPLQPVRVKVFYFKEKRAGSYSIARAPITVQVDADGLHVYSLPAYEYPNLLKIAYHDGPKIEPDSRDLNPEASQIYLDKIVTYVREHCPGLEEQPSVIETCIYTWTPDEDFIIDHHPKFKNIVFGAGFSGHGFKLAPVSGKLLMELVTGKQPSYDMKPFKMDRFNVSKAKL